MTRAPRFRLKFSRDTLLFVLGLAGLVYETISGGAEKPTLIIAFVGMMGLPLFIRGNDDDDEDPPRRPPRPRPAPHGKNRGRRD